MEIFFNVLLIAQLIINLSSPEKCFIDQLIIQCAKFFFRFVKSWISVSFSFFFNISEKSVFVPSITILLNALIIPTFLFYFVVISNIF